jgi:hypothetical protein
MRAVLLLAVLAACGNGHCNEISTNVSPGKLDVAYKGCSGGDHQLHCAVGADLMCSCDGRDFRTNESSGSNLPDEVVEKECGFTP